MIDASGTLAAIGQAFGGKNAKAMGAFRAALGGSGDAATAQDSHNMATLRERMRQSQRRGAA